MKKILIIILVAALASCSKKDTSASCRTLIATTVNSSSGISTSDTTTGYNCGFIYERPVPLPRVINDSITIYYTVK